MHRWLPDLRIELVQFPFGAHDDQCGMLGLAGQLLDKVVAGRKPIAELVDELKCGYRDKDDDDLVGRMPSILTM
jgi:hypothetical protein